MISLRVFLMIVVTLVVQQLGKQLDEPATQDSIVALIGYCVAFSVVAKFSAVLAIWNSEECIKATWAVVERFMTYRRSLELAWIGLLPVALLGTGWSAYLGSLNQNHWSHAYLLLLWMLPSLGFLLALDMCQAQLELHVLSVLAAKKLRTRALRSTVEAEGDSVPSIDRHEKVPQLMTLWRNQVRLGPTSGAILCGVPMLVVVAGIDLQRSWLPQLSVPYQAAFSALTLLFLMVVAGPTWMSAWMGARTLDEGRWVDRIRHLARISRIATPKLKSIPSEQSWQGAAVVGWSRLNRQLWLGDALFEVLNPREIDMVVLHELAHLHRYHGLWRSAAVLGSVFSSLGVWWLCRTTLQSMSLADWLTSDQISFASSLSEVTSVAVAVVGLVTGLGIVARRCELDADREACNLAARACEWCLDEPHAAGDHLASALRKLCPQSDEQARAAWLHPSIQSRCQALSRLRVAE